jgi:hypothetical protein
MASFFSFVGLFYVRYFQKKRKKERERDVRLYFQYYVGVFSYTNISHLGLISF